MDKEKIKMKRKKLKEKKEQTKKEFRQFILRGNIVDLAVAVAVGSAFTAIVNSFVNDIIGGVVGYLMSDVDLSSLKINLGSGENAPSIKYGAFIQAILYFFIVAFVMFFIVKIMAKINRDIEKRNKKNSVEVEEVKPEVEKVIEDNTSKDSDEQLQLLREIRDLLKEEKK